MPHATARRRPAALTCALASAAALALAACSADAAPADDASSPPASATTASAQPTASPSVYDPYPDRPAPTVEPWPDSGDFFVDVTKATVPAATLAQEERWDDHDLLNRIVGTAQARWIGSWSTNDAIANYARQVYEGAADADRTGLIAYYGLRDTTCEEAAADPAQGDAYLERTRVLVDQLPASGAQAWIVLEPGLVTDLGACDSDPRADWVGQAAAIIAQAGGAVYLDAGVVDDPRAVAAGLERIDLAGVAGIAVGTNGYRAPSEQVALGEQALALLADAGVAVDSARTGPDPGQAGLGIIVDTSRSGVPIADSEPCNPPEAGIGVAPELVGEGALDARVWIKRVGESDGACEGGPTRGQFSQALALRLAANGSLDAQ